MFTQIHYLNYFSLGLLNACYEPCTMLTMTSKPGCAVYIYALYHWHVLFPFSSLSLKIKFTHKFYYASSYPPLINQLIMLSASVPGLLSLFTRFTLCLCFLSLWGRNNEQTELKLLKLYQCHDQFSSVT